METSPWSNENKAENLTRNENPSHEVGTTEKSWEDDDLWRLSNFCVYFPFGTFSVYLFTLFVK